MVTKVYIPLNDADADKNQFSNFLKGFFPQIKTNVKKGIREKVTTTENKIYEKVNKPLKSTNPLDYPQIAVNGLCKGMDKVLDVVNAVLRVLFF